MPTQKTESILHRLIHTRWFNRYTTTLLISVYLYFLFNHITAIWSGTISAMVYIFVAMETVVISLLFIRKHPIARSAHINAWLFALLGTILPLAFMPSSFVLHERSGEALMMLGGCLAIFSYLSLNTSFGIAPAIRTVKTSGLYQIVRHPMYLSYIVLYSGYNLLSFSPLNLAIYLGLIIFIVGRIFYEEQLLATDPAYLAYKKEVPYRLIPGVY